MAEVTLIDDRYQIGDTCVIVPYGFELMWDEDDQAYVQDEDDQTYIQVEV